MVLKPEPVYAAFKHIGIRPGKKTSPWPARNKPLVIYLSPQGKSSTRGC